MLGKQSGLLDDPVNERGIAFAGFFIIRTCDNDINICIFFRYNQRRKIPVCF